MIIGLTGGIATGKSTVSKMIREMGIPIVDADVIARKVVVQGETAYKKIVSHFGNEILDSNGDINRKKLGELIFNDDSKRLALNSIIHPEIRIRIEQEIHLLKRTGNRIIVIDVPLLFETNYTSFVDKIITIFVEEDIQIERLKKRDQISTVEALARVNTQIPLSQKVKNSDAVIYNNAAIEETYQQLVHVLEKWGCIKT